MVSAGKIRLYLSSEPNLKLKLNNPVNMNYLETSWQDTRFHPRKVASPAVFDIGKNHVLE